MLIYWDVRAGNKQPRSVTHASIQHKPEPNTLFYQAKADMSYALEDKTCSIRQRKKIFPETSHKNGGTFSENDEK